MYSAYKLNKQGDNKQPWCTLPWEGITYLKINAKIGQKSVQADKKQRASRKDIFNLVRKVYFLLILRKIFEYTQLNLTVNSKLERYRIHSL